MQDLLIPFVNDNETVLWRGQPNEKYYLEIKQCLERKILVFSLALLVICVWSNIMQHTHLPVLSLLFAIVVLIGITSFTRKQSTVPEFQYAITDKRILFVGPGDTGIEARHLKFEQIKKVKLQSHGHGVSTIVFVPTFLAPNIGIKFHCVNEAATVKNLVLSLKAQPL